MRLHRLAKILGCLATLLVAPIARAGSSGFTVTPLLIEFGTLDVGVRESKTIILTNNGAASLTVTGFVKSGASSISVDVAGGSDPCSTENPTLAAGESCTMNVEYAPVAVEDVQAVLTLTPNNDGLEAISLSITAAAEDGGGGCSLTPVRDSSGMWGRLTGLSR